LPRRRLFGYHNNMSNMRSSERGSMLILVPLVLAVVMLVAAVVFGGWAYGKMQDYKNNVDAKVSVAVDAAKQQEAAAKDAEFAQLEKQPLKSYTGPAAYGSVSIKYPKTWSAYVSDSDSSTPYVDGYFYPNVVPDIQSPSSAFALRVQVVQQSYSNVLTGLAGFVQQKQATVTPYAAPKVPSVIGVRVDGKLGSQKSGSMVVLPLRNMTLEIWTEAPSFQNDFDKNILPNFTFAP
jgi:hypothetical protein